MSNDLRNRDALEEFYYNTFNSEEIDVPADFTDAVMDNLSGETATTQNKTWSEKIGAKKLFKFLKISMVLNLITVGTLGYYVLNNKTETIKIETPFKEVIIDEHKASESAIKKNKEVLEEVNRTNYGTEKAVRPVNNKLENASPSIPEVFPETKTSEVVNSPDTSVVINGDHVISEAIDSAEVELTHKKVEEKVESNKPKSLKDLRSKLKDTLEGKKLFKDK